MEAIITGKGIDITPAIRSYIDNKMKKVHRLVSDVIDVNITLSTEKHLINADFSVKTNSQLFTAHGSTTDIFASINEGLDNLIKQARRSNKKIKNKKGKARMELADLPALDDLPDTMLDAEEDSPAEDVKVHKESMPIKPLSLEEAKLQIRGTTDGIILYENATSSQINLLYRKKDGSLGLVEVNK